MKRAIISVSDKTGVADFAKALVRNGYEIISTGGTAALLKNSGVETLDVESITGFPECLDGRVKTLHPKIYGGVLAIRNNDLHMETLNKFQIDAIDLICVNLYPFKSAVEKPGHTLEEAIENIDIGGPSLLRAGAKNHRYVTVVTSPEDYAKVISGMDASGGVSEDLRFRLAAKAFSYTAAYDALICGYLSEKAGAEKFPELLTLTFERKQMLRYGENPHQRAAYYVEPLAGGSCVTGAELLNGKELSYNNLGDVDAAVALVKEFYESEPVCVAIKHAAPCGVACGADSREAFGLAYEADPVSIFGGVLAFNRLLDGPCALAANEIFLETIIAPEYTDEALNILKRKQNLRVLLLKDISCVSAPEKSALTYKKISGGLLLQDTDKKVYEKCEKIDYKLVTKARVSDKQIEELVFAMKVCKHVKSNAIVVAKGRQTLGIGGGSVSRIWAAQAALARAGELAKGAVMASDAFFPFDDVVAECSKAGISAIIQPGGSVNDQLSIDACDRHGLAMIFTGVRHFKH